MESTTNPSIFPKLIGMNDQIGFGGITMLVATFIQLLIQIPLFRPLYRLAGKDRYALFIVFYKAFCTLPISLQTILGLIIITDPQLNSYNAWFCVAISFKLALKLLVLLFTFCRFWAIMSPWGYERIWSKKRINFYAILTILISIVICCLATIHKMGGVFLDIYTYTSQFSILLAIAFYFASIVRLTVQKCTMMEITMENDRIKIMIICLATMLPMLIDQLPFYLFRIGQIFDPNFKRIVWPSWFPLLQVNQVIMTCFDEYTLLLICAEFRALVKKELIIIFGKFICKKYRIGNAQQQLNHHHSISTNSWMRGLDENYH